MMVTSSELPAGPAISASASDGPRDDVLTTYLPMKAPSLALNVIAIIVVFCALYFAASLLVPIAVAVLLSMLLAPPVSFLEKFKFPRPLASAAVVIVTILFLGAGLIALAGPAASWIERAPQSLHKIQQKLEGLQRPFEEMKKATEEFQDAAGNGKGAGPQQVRIMRPALTDTMLLGSPQIIGSVLSVTILTLFLLASGDVFLRKLVTIIPTLKDKKRAVEITRQIEMDISFYLLSFTSVNIGLGVIMTGVSYFLGIPNPLLWGVVVAVLNFVPYVGAVTSMAILTLVGLQTFDSVPVALIAPAVQLVLFTLSGQLVMPVVLGRGLQLNPVAIFVSIMLWGWLWGIVGVLLAVPLLASFKIICERIEPMHPIAEFLTT